MCDQSGKENELLPVAEAISLSKDISMEYGYAAFTSTISVPTLSISVPQGTHVAPTIWTSSDVYLPSCFNSTGTTSALSWSGGNTAVFSDEFEVMHNILVYYKIHGSSANFINRRVFKCFLVNDLGIRYDEARLQFTQQPASSARTTAIINGNYAHVKDDVVKLVFVVTQDDKNSGQGDTLLTIFNINWTITGLRKK
jgi:hypothetical protein